MNFEGEAPAYIKTDSQHGLDAPLETRMLQTHHLADREWRLNNLYHVLNEQRKIVQFQMRPLQRDFYKRWWWRNILLKSRQIGGSTLIQLSGLDGAVFIPNFKTVIISHKKDSAADLLEENALLPYMNLHPELRSRVKLIDNNKTTLTFSNGSSVEVTNSGRSGNGNFLHISEFGYIAAKRPDIAREIIAGTLPGFHQGAMVFIESTAEGSDGQFYDMTQVAQNMQISGTRLTEMDFKFHFYGWQDRPENSLSEEESKYVQIPNRLEQYFEDLREKEGIETSPQQRAWYTVQERTLKQDMKKEQPATPKEAFEASGEGKILALQMAQMREDKRITEVPVVVGRPIYTFWDLGLNDETAIAFMQNVGTSWHCVKYMEGTDDGLIEWVRRVREIAVDNRWNLADWVGPHDLKKRSGATGDTVWDETKYATGIGFKIVPKVANKKVAIDKLRGLMSTLRIDEKACEQLIKHLDKYRWEYDEIRAVYKDKPYHGPESNGADAMQTWAMHTSDVNRKDEQLAMGRQERQRGQARPQGRSKMRGYM